MPPTKHCLLGLSEAFGPIANRKPSRWPVGQWFCSEVCGGEVPAKCALHGKNVLAGAAPKRLDPAYLLTRSENSWWMAPNVFLVGRQGNWGQWFCSEDCGEEVPDKRALHGKNVLAGAAPKRLDPAYLLTRNDDSW